jgi:hypothetical protein
MPFEPPIISTAYAASIVTVQAIIEDIDIEIAKLLKKMSQLDAQSISYGQELSEAKAALEALIAFSDLANQDKATQEEHERRIAQKKKEIEDMAALGSSKSMLAAQGRQIELALLQVARTEWVNVLPTLEHNRDVTAEFEASLRAVREANQNPTNL